MPEITITNIENGYLVQIHRRNNDVFVGPERYYCIDINEINRRVEEALINV